MSTNRFRLRVGLTTLMVVSVMLAFSLSAADAAKPGTPPPPPVTYAMRLMPLPSGVPAGTSLYATGMNNAGQVVAWGYVWNWAPDPALDEVISLDEQILDPAVHAVLSAELAATWDAENQRIADENLRRSKLDPPLLPLPFVAWPFGVRELRFENAAINDFGQGTTPPFTEFGQIAAAFTFSTADGGEACHVFRFTPARGTTPAEFLDLGLPAGWGSVTVRAINNLGNIVGDVEYGIDAGSMPVLWDCLGNPGDPLDNAFNMMPDLIDGSAWSINDLNQVTGGMLLGGAYHAYRYTPGDLSPEDLGVLYSRNPGSIGRDINNLGDVAGWSYVTRPKDSWYDRYGIAHAFLDTGAGLIDLGALSSGGSTRACWINDIGNVVGSARSGSPNWTPTWFLYTSETGMLDLLKLVNGLPPGTTGDTCTLSGINDYPTLDNPGPFGQICGTIAIEGVWMPFVLTPDR